MLKIITLLLLGIAMICIGINNIKGNISSIHWYNRKNLKESDIPKYGKCVGLGSVIIGISLAISALLEMIFKSNIYFLVTSIFFIYFLLKTAYPPKFECMRVVKRYLSLKELKNFIEQEKFEIFRVENISDPFELYYSDKWLFINDVYIPRKLILDGVAIKESLMELRLKSHFTLHLGI